MLVNYKINNFCIHCRSKLPKDQTRCEDCGWLARTNPIKKREEDIVRY